MKADYPLSVLCAVLEVQRSGYYAWASGRHNRRATRDRELQAHIAEAFVESRETYGYPRITRELHAKGQAAGKTRVARLMQEAGLQGRPPRRFRPRTTLSDHAGPIAPNRLADLAAPTACDQVWQTDITYLKTDEGWLYLAVILDAFSKRILGWAFAETLHADFVLSAFAMAVAHRGGRIPRDLLVHSDRGCQYASAAFRALLESHHALASMSRRGNCYDNARAEAFFSTLKLEFVYRHRFATRAIAQRAVFEWIEAFYNRRRRHSTLGYLSPIDFENQLN